MVDPKVIEAVNLFRSSLESEGIRIHDPILFGSASSGSLQPGSDIDLAIISDDFSGKDIFTRARMGIPPGTNPSGRQIPVLV